MAELHGFLMGVILTTYKSWDDDPWGCEIGIHPGVMEEQFLVEV